MPLLLDRPTRRAGFVDARLVADWASIVGPEIGEAAVPLRLDRRNRCLVVLVRPTAALLLQHEEPRLLERINLFFGTEVAHRLRLVQGPLPRAVPAVEPAVVAPAEAARIDRSLRSVEDAGLRAALLRLGLAIASRRAARP